MKKYLKTIHLSTTVVFLAISIFTYIKFDQSDKTTQSEDTNNWKTYNKVSQDKIESYPTTHKEKDEMKVESTKKNDRKTASKTSMPTPSLKHRAWRGIGPRPLSSEVDNEYNPLWKEELGKNLLRFLRPKTKSIVRREGSALIKHKGKNLLVEHVLVKLKSPEGRHFGYNAYVDSQSGKVVKTWNRTIHEQYSRSALRLSPTR